MKSGDPANASATVVHEDSTGLPAVRTWPLVYGWVLASFVTWVVLLLALERYFS